MERALLAWLPFVISWTLIVGAAWIVWRILRRLNVFGRDEPPSSARKPE
jgi:hypothetical protein